MAGKVSIIIPTFEHAKSLPGCLASIYAQTYPSIEIIVVDDGSTDNTQEVLSNYRDVRVVTQENKGANPARNAGAEHATGEHLFFCDADLILRADAIEKFVSALEENPDADFAYSAFRFGFKRFRGVPFNAERLKNMNYIHTSSLIRRAKFPGFDPAIRRLQDWDLWLTMIERGSRGVLVDEYLFRVRIDGNSRIGSRWLPKWVFWLPWKRLPVMPSLVRRYLSAKEEIQKKHAL